MASNIYAWVLISVIAVGVFTVARMAFASVVEVKRIDGFRNVFLALTAITFLVKNFWLALVLAAVTVIILGRGEKEKTVLWVAAAFAMPDIVKPLQGFAGINQLFVFGPLMVLTAVILGPGLFQDKRKQVARHGVTLSDVGVIGYLAVASILSFRDVSATAGIKASLSIFLATAPIYFVFSRRQWTSQNVNALAVAYVSQLLIFAVLILPEYLIQWHHYYTALWQWDINFRNLNISRGGLYRVVGPAIVPIAFGGMFMVAISFAMMLYKQVTNKLFALGGLGALVFGIAATLSRGPWIGTLLGLTVREALSPKGMARLVRFGGVALVLLVIASFTPYGRTIINMMPFIGSTDTAETFDYRERLFQAGATVVGENPLFGSTTYLDHPRMQELVQGQGIIDIVNSYLQLALDYGLVGLGAYLLALLSALMALWRSIKILGGRDPALRDQMVTILGCTMGMSLLLVTTTWIVGPIEELNWMLIGLCVGLARTARQVAATEEAGAAGQLKMPTPEPIPSDENPVPKRVWRAPQPRPGTRQPQKSTPAHLRQYARAGKAGSSPKTGKNS